MENIEYLLNQLLEKLEKEKELLIKTVTDSKYVDELMKVVEEKREILSQLSKFKAEDFTGLEDKLEKIRYQSKVNLNLAANNAQFIDEIFDAIFEEPEKYDKTGSTIKERHGFINKKI